MTSRLTVALFSVFAVSAPRLARAQPAPAPMSNEAYPAPQALPATPPIGVTEQDTDAYCRANWFAVDRCHDRPWSGPRILFGLDLGVAKMNESGPFGFGNGIGSVTDAGPAWGVRAGVELLSWLAVEAHYVGAYDGAHASVSPAGSVGFLTTGVDAVLRFTAPLPYVHPYILGGIGYYDLGLTGTSSAKAGSVLVSSSQPGVPLGVGLDVPLTYHLSIGAEAVYHFQIGETTASISTNNIDGGDVSTFDLVARLRL